VPVKLIGVSGDALITLASLERRAGADEGDQMRRVRGRRLGGPPHEQADRGYRPDAPVRDRAPVHSANRPSTTSANRSKFAQLFSTR
jgi:hypothetical protein